MKAYRAVQGGGIVFSRPGGYRDLPLTLACGQCSGCRLEYSRQWAVRLMHEAQLHERNCFITLTYDEENLPDDQSLDVRHWQLFAKSLRNHLAKTHAPEEREFRFFHCGEYGDRTMRPHYHAAIFGQDFAEDRKFYKQSKQGDNLYSSEILNSIWKKGYAVIGDLTFQSAAYVARYIMKKQNGEKAIEKYGTKVLVDPGQAGTSHASLTYKLKREYTTMSRRPGIGSKWIEKFHTDVYPSDEVITNGQSARPPKYYDQQLEIIDPALHRKIKVRRSVEGQKHEENNTYTRLAIRKTVHQARMSQYKRDQH